MFRTADQSSIKLINCKAIVETLIENGNMSKSNLSKFLHISKPTVTENVNVLINLGIVHEIGQGSSNSKGGRKPTLLEFNKQYKYIVAIDLKLIDPIFAIGDLSFNILNEKKLYIGKPSTSQEKINASIKTIEELLEKTNIKTDDLGAIVISSPGLIGENSEDFYSNPQHRPWTDINLQSHLENHFKVNVIIKNDVNLAVIGEHTIGYKKEHENMVYISCGVGVGAGIVLNHKLYEGKRHGAGEIGYFTDFKKHSLKRSLEDTISINAILEKVELDVKNNNASDMIMNALKEKESIEFDDLVRTYESGDSYIKNIMYEVGLEIGYALNNIIAMLDIDLALIDGEYLVFSDSLMEGINEVIKDLYLFKPIVTVSSLNSEASIYGALVMGFDYIFDELQSSI